MDSKDSDSLLEFPCEYPLKVIGRGSDEFYRIVHQIVMKHVPDLKQEASSSRSSKKGNYLAITVTFTAESRAQLQALYQELNDHELVVMTL